MQYKDDFEALEPYYRAWWAGEMLDRVAVSIHCANSERELVLPCWRQPSWVNGHTDAEVLDAFEAWADSMFFGGLASPCFWPNLGPDVFSAFFGADLKFSADSDNTSWIDWSDKVLKSYDDLSCLDIRDDNPHYTRIMDLTRLACERSAGRYLVGATDIHGGFDALSVLRGGPEVASIDLIENCDGVRAAMNKLADAWVKVYDDHYALVKDLQVGTSTWMGIWAPGRMYAVQSDFSCLVSVPMFKEFLLDEIMTEVNALDYSIYHLDGVEALHHVDALLEIDDLNAMQWVRGAKYQDLPISRWYELYQRFQAAGKAIVVYPRPEEIPEVLENLNPEGLLIQTYTETREQAEAVLKSLGW